MGYKSHPNVRFDCHPPGRALKLSGRGGRWWGPMDSNTTLCFTCGQSANCGEHLNRLDDGRICPTCAERFMDSLPPLLPGNAPEDAEVGEVALDLPTDSDTFDREEA